MDREIERPYAVAMHGLDFACLGIREDRIRQHTIDYLYQSEGVGRDCCNLFMVYIQAVGNIVIARHVSRPVIYFTLTDRIRFVILITRVAC